MVCWYGTQHDAATTRAIPAVPADVAIATRTATSTKSSQLSVSATISSLVSPIGSNSMMITNSMSSMTWRCHKSSTNDDRCHRAMQLMRCICAIIATIMIADIPCITAVAPLAWTYLKGPSPITSGRAAVVGALGVESSTYYPGAMGGCGAVDPDGNYWVYGGDDVNTDDSAKLMKYNVATGNWAFMGGRTGTNAAGVFPATKNTEGATYYPGARDTSCNLVVDSTYGVWLFGGNGFGYNTDGPNGLTDLWRWRPTTGQWNWVAGSKVTNAWQASVGTKGVYSTSFWPWSRYGSCRARKNDVLYIFGGVNYYNSFYGYLPMNDMWTFNLANPTLGWAWVAGTATESMDVTGSFGTKGTPSSSVVPYPRYYSAMDFDSINGLLWMFGGNYWDTSSNYLLNDLFTYNIATALWCWVGGSTKRDSSAGYNYGTLGVASSTNQPGARYGHGLAADVAGMLWVVGGTGFNSGSSRRLNDVWRYDVTTSQWTWFGGSSTGGSLASSFGTLGVQATTNIMGTRQIYTNLVIDSFNNMIIRAGRGDLTGNTGSSTAPLLDEMWRPNAWLKCPAGQTKPSPIEDACSNCPAGRYGTIVGEGRPLCENTCPMGYYCPAATSSPTQYPCPAGYYGSSSGLSSSTCTAICPANYWCGTASTSGTANPCPSNSQSAAGSQSASACICAAGYGTSGSSCVPCLAGQYSLPGIPCTNCNAGYWCTAGSSSPTQNACPSHSTSPAGSSSSTACACDIGYGTSSCTACSAGQAKPLVGSQACTACFPGTYSTSTAAASCIACDAGRYGSVTGETSSTCTGLCSAGYYCPAGSSNATAMACPAGTYSTSTGATSATCSGLCSAGYYCPAGSTAITCPTNSMSAAGAGDITACRCIAGYTGNNGGPCTACSIGQYKSVIGSATCTQCPAGTYGSTTGLTTSACSGACDAGSYCLIGSTSSSGTLCPAGTYGSSTGLSTAACSGQCAANCYCIAGSTSATQQTCPQNSQSPAGSGSAAACQCSAGYSGTSCDPCQPGKAKPLGGSGTCDVCIAGQYTDLQGAITCSQCPAGTYGATTGLSTAGCSGACQQGYYCVAGSTVSNAAACPAGTYGSTTGLSTASCSGACQPGYYCEAASTMATQSLCPAQSTSLAGAASIADCLCGAGYSGTGSSCTPCDAGYYKSTTGAGTCSQCPTGSTSLAGSSTCSCSPGYGLQGDPPTCVACDLGTYTSALGSSTCSGCAIGYYGNALGQTNAQCSGACVAGSYGSTTGLSSPTCSGLCLAGYYGQNTARTSSSCDGACPAGYFCPTGTIIPTSNPCPLNTISIAGAAAATGCGCVAGWTGADGGPCTQCAAGRYKSQSGPGAVACTACPANSYSNDGASSSQQCGCVAGYTGSGGVSCTACAAGRYKESSGSAACDVCPSFSTSTSAARLLANCTCIAGYSGSSGSCSACTIGSYKANAGDGSCLTCPTRTTTTTQASTICSCVSGYSGPDGGTCTACPINFWKSTIGSGACTVCADRSHSAAASTSPTSCLCDTGFQGPAGGPCVDINECLVNNGGCGNGTLCLNTPGSRVCGSCPFGYSLSAGACIQIGIVSGTLHLLNGNNTYDDSGDLQLPSLDAGALLTFQVSGNWTLAADQNYPATDTCVFGYGTTASPQRFQCVDIRAMMITDGALTQVNCTLQAGYGSDLLFSMWLFNGTGYIQLITDTISPDWFSYPLPLITSRSLRRSDLSSSLGSALLVAATNYLPESISFDGNYFINDATIMAVYYGPSYAPKLFQCTLDTTATSVTTVTCLTQSQIAGSNKLASDMFFTVTTSGFDIRGSDAYRFPVVPELLAVWGCNNDTYPTMANSTFNCPTTGGIPITMLGDGFTGIQNIYINSASCTNIIVIDTFDHTIYLGSTMVVCTLPVGCGFDQPIVISANQQFSETKRFLSYAIPTITTLDGCSPISSGINNCDRLGYQFITIRGQNFGPIGARVLIGNYDCVTLGWVSHQELRCQTPPGTGLDRPVVVIQANGKISQSQLSLSYAICPSGTIPFGLDCADCAIGLYNPVDGATTCVECDPGLHTSETGSARCSKCAPGTKRAKGEASCTNCTIGRFSPSDGQDTCSPCIAGTYIAIEGALSCLSCPLGQFYDDIGATACGNCTAGFYTPSGAASQCTSCPRGKYAPVNGSSICPLCTAGTFAPYIEYTTCDLCLPGQLTAVDGLSQCDLCTAGTYSGSYGSSTCTQCAAGRYTSDPGKSICQPCPQSSYSNVPGLSECLKCSAQSVAPYPGMTACIECPVGALPSDDKLRCICGIGLYEYPNADGTRSCLRCPLGAQCSAPGQTWDDLATASGWWRANNESLSYYRCLRAAHCLGGVDSTCGENRRGVLCSLCNVGYKAGDANSACTICPKQNTALGSVIGLSIAAIFGLCILYWLVLRRGTPTLRASYQDMVAENPLVVLSKEYRSPVAFTFNLKILVGFVQIATCLTSLTEIPWPSAFQTFISAFSVVNLDFVPWQSVSCVTPFDFYTKLVAITLIPPGLLGAVLLFFMLPVWLYDKYDMSDDNTSRERHKIWWRYLWRIVLFTLFLLYPGVSSRILSFFLCKNVEGTSYLVADFTLECGSPRWLQFLGYAIFMLLVYPIGIPVAFFVLLYRQRHVLADPLVLQTNGFLYQAYHIDMWWFELADMATKLFLTSIIGFFSADWQMPVGICYLVCFIIFILLQRPYIRSADDRMQLMATTELFLFMLIGYVVQFEDLVAGTGVDIALSILLIASTVAVVGLCIAHFVLLVRETLQHARRRSRAGTYAHDKSVGDRTSVTSAVLELVLGRMGSRIHLRGSSADEADSRSAAASVAAEMSQMSIGEDNTTGSGPPSPGLSPFPSPTLQPINGSSRLNPGIRSRAESDI